MKLKKALSLILSMAIILCAIPAVNYSAAQVTEITAPQFVQENQLYVLGLNTSKEAWQRWESYSGLNAQEGVKYFFLPEQADRNNLTIYNSYKSDVVMNGVTVKGNSWGSVPYTKGQKAIAVCSGRTYEYIVLTSDSDASIYVNDTKNDYTNDEGKHFTDFYEFLIDNKENSVKDSDVAIVSADGLTEVKLKKFKGRGNTNWHKSEKKQFNFTFYDNVNISGVEGKKFSLINNGRDGSLIRSRTIFDVANQVGLPYSTDTRYIDLYINGSYRGCFQISKKVEMGKSQLISLKDTSEDEGVVDNFNFAVEIDIWNAGNDTHFTSKYGQVVALNTPELDDYNSSDPVQKAQMDFIQGKYAEFEDALYKGNMSKLESICDIELLAKAYLIQEWTKNCDGGLTSTYYTYDASTGKFQAAPVWDFDSGLGNVDCIRGGADISTVYPNGWLTKTVTNDAGRSRYVNTLGQAFNLSGTTSEGKTFKDYVVEVWKNDFIPAIKVAVGQATSISSRLRPMAQYISENENAFYNNYVIWGFEWGPEKGLGYSYPFSYQGQVDYLQHWTIARTNWMTKELLGDSGELLKEPEPPTYPTTALEENASFYLVGTLDDVLDWDTRNYPLTLNETRTKATIDLTLQKGLKYRFKVAKVINNERREHYVADYEKGVTSQYFFADESTANLNVMAKHTETVTLTLVFDVHTGLFIAYPQGEVPTDPIVTEPIETTESSEPTDSSETEPVPTQPTESEPTPTETEPTEEKAPSVTLKSSKINAGNRTRVIVSDVGSKKVTYTSSDKKIAKIDKNGVITGLDKGKVKISVKIGSKTTKKTLTVKTAPKVKYGKTSLKTGKTIVIKKGKTKKLTVTGKAKAINNKVNLKNIKVAKITSKANQKKVVIKAKRKGTTTLTVVINGVKKYKYKISVK